MRFTIPRAPEMPTLEFAQPAKNRAESCGDVAARSGGLWRPKPVVCGLSIIALTQH
jgi:hypothetical protein